MDFERPPTVFLILLPIMLSYQSPLCPMCTQHLRDSSDHVGALSRSSNETVDSEDMDSVSLGILLEKPYDCMNFEKASYSFLSRLLCFEHTITTKTYILNTLHRPLRNADPHSLCAIYVGLHCSMMCCQ